MIPPDEPGGARTGAPDDRDDAPEGRGGAPDDRAGGVDDHDDGADGYDEMGDDRVVWYLNRTLAVLRARKPFHTWLLRNWDEAEALTLAELRERPTALLVPPFEEEVDVRQWIFHNAVGLLHVALQDWFVPDDLWPQLLDGSVLNRWFDLELIEYTWDLVDGPLTSEPAGTPDILHALDEEDFAPA